MPLSSDQHGLFAVKAARNFEKLLRGRNEFMERGHEAVGFQLHGRQAAREHPRFQNAHPDVPDDMREFALCIEAIRASRALSNRLRTRCLRVDGKARRGDPDRYAAGSRSTV
mgnify:CR=1 FL=1